MYKKKSVGKLEKFAIELAELQEKRGKEIKNSKVSFLSTRSYYLFSNIWYLNYNAYFFGYCSCYGFIAYGNIAKSVVISNNYNPKYSYVSRTS